MTVIYELRWSHLQILFYTAPDTRFVPQLSQSRFEAERTATPPVRPDGLAKPRFIDRVATTCLVKHSAHRNLEAETFTWEVLLKGGTDPGAARLPEWLVVALLGELTAILPLVNRFGQVVSRPTLQRGPEPDVGPDPTHFPRGERMGRRVERVSFAWEREKVRKAYRLRSRGGDERHGLHYWTLPGRSGATCC